MLIEHATHSQQVYDPTDDSIMAEQELCMERLYDYNHTRPSEHVKRARLLKEMLAECGAGSDCNQRKTGSSRWGTPCLTYRVWIFAGCVRVGAPCFCYLSVQSCTQFIDLIKLFLPFRSQVVTNKDQGQVWIG